jgi:hypothetical protein
MFPIHIETTPAAYNNLRTILMRLLPPSSLCVLSLVALLAAIAPAHAQPAPQPTIKADARHGHPPRSASSTRSRRKLHRRPRFHNGTRLARLLDQRRRLRRTARREVEPPKRRHRRRASVSPPPTRLASRPAHGLRLRKRSRLPSSHARRRRLPSHHHRKVNASRARNLARLPRSLHPRQRRSSRHPHRLVQARSQPRRRSSRPKPHRKIPVPTPQTPPHHRHRNLQLNS